MSTSTPGNSEMNDFTKNDYQLNKTLRFGLTINENKSNKTHSVLNESIQLSLDVVKKNAETIDKMGEDIFVKKISTLFNEIKCFSENWGAICLRTDQIAVSKDFYRILTKKARFDGGKEKAQTIKLSSLRSKYQNRELYSYITTYWQDIQRRQQQLIKQLEPLLDQYKTAVEKQDKAHRKPNLVNFSKLFFSLNNLINEVLRPLKDYSICFPGIDKMEGRNDDNILKKFVTETNFGRLYDDIAEMKDYLNSNGGYTPYAMVTLNHYTAEQKPHDYKAEIDNIIKEMKVVELINKLKDKSEKDIYDYFAGLNKIEVFNNSYGSIIERAQCFKYKPIPALTKYGLATLIAQKEKINEKAILKVLDNIGIPRSIGEDYSKLTKEEQENFNLNQYPLKVVFDYAWENLARNVYRQVDFPHSKCEDFLNKLFGCNAENDSNFKLYANLLFIKENLATLEHDKNKPNQPEHYIYRITKTFDKINWPSSKNNKHKEVIVAWLEKTEAEQALEKKSGNNCFRNYETAKLKLGLLRGGLKNNIKAHLDLTNEFKKVASSFGKKFADLRDKFREENEFNKISHFGVVIEDGNNDRYLLINSLNKNNKTLNDEERKNAVTAIIDSISDHGELTAYQVKSLTSKALRKIVQNCKTYKDFHQSTFSVNHTKIKKEWADYQNDREFLTYLKSCLQDSTMAKNQDWSAFGWNFDNCQTYEDFEREIDKKSYTLQKGKISKEAIGRLVAQGCLLFPIVNQDITSKNRQNKNQFSKDWQAVFDNQQDFRLHPEFRISYRTPTKGYPANKRFGRLQFIANFNCEIIPQDRAYLSRKEQLELFNDQDKQKKAIEKFSSDVKTFLTDDYVVIGIDRGIKQLATLCTLDKTGKIIGDFEIYKKEFDSVQKQWKHTLFEKRHILDLSNLRVETTVDGKKVLVDQNLTLVKENRNTPDEAPRCENQQKIKLKQLAYIRKLQYQMQTNEQAVCDLLKPDADGNAPSKEEIEKRIKESDIISPYGEGKAHADLPTQKLIEMISDFKMVIENGNNQTEKNKIIELDASDNLKRGIVANMIGVVNFILEQFNYKTYISLENLCRAYGGSKDGLNGRYLPSTNQDKDVDFKEQQNLMLAGLGTYQFFEMQLLKKLFKVQQQRDIYHFVPAFRSVDNYENIQKLSEYEINQNDPSKGVYFAKPFGIVHFIDPKMTSSKCPLCGKTGKKFVNRNLKRANILQCNKCLYTSIWEKNQKENLAAEDCHFDDKKISGFVSNNNKLITKHKKDNMNLEFIHNGDDNGAYHIALKTVSNLQKAVEKKQRSKLN